MVRKRRKKKYKKKYNWHEGTKRPARLKFSVIGVPKFK